MIRIAIVEDDRHDREALKKCLNRYEKENQVKFSVTEFQDGEDIVTDYTASYDLIILDIEMAFLNGMKAAEKIRELDTNVIIIFITNMPQYAIQGYKVNALDYILKPISYFSFSESMVRALAKVKTPEKEYITIVLKGGKKKLDVARICYVEVQDHVLIYHTLDGDFETKGTMRDTDNQFDPKKYFRCNRCYLVNLEFVETYQGSDIMVNGDTIQVSRSRRKPFLDALNEYMNEGHSSQHSWILLCHFLLAFCTGNDSCAWMREKRCVEICAWGVELYQYFYRYVFYRWNKADVFHASYGLCVFADAFVHQDGRRASMA